MIRIIGLLIVTVLVGGVLYVGVSQISDTVGGRGTPNSRLQSTTSSIFEEQILSVEEVTEEEVKDSPVITESPSVPDINVQQEEKAVTVEIEPPRTSQVEPPKGFTVDDLSPNFGKVIITSVRPQYSVSSPHMLSLFAQLSRGESVNVTGWRIEGNVGNRVFVPKAIGDYNARNLQDGDIVLVSSDEIRFFFNKSASGRNLRLNKCTGYLNNIFEFNPTLTKQCPRVDRSDIIAFPGDCQEILLSFSTCEESTSRELNKKVVRDDAACRSFMEDINYNGCYKNHRGDTDFLDNKWWVWLDQVFQVHPTHDRILLFDKSGLLVDEYVY